MIHINDSNLGIIIAKAAGTTFNPYADQSIARTKNGVLLGGVTYTDFTYYSIFTHIASFDPDWIDRDFLWVIFDYPFNQLKVANIFCNVKENNKKALTFVSKLGFKEVVRIPGIYQDHLVIMLRMHRDFCKWLALGPRKIKVI